MRPSNLVLSILIVVGTCSKCLLAAPVPQSRGDLQKEASALRASAAEDVKRSKKLSRLAASSDESARRLQATADRLEKTAIGLIEKGSSEAGLRLLEAAEVRAAKAQSARNEATEKREQAAALATLAQEKLSQAESKDACARAFVTLFENDNYKKRSITLRFGNSPADLKRNEQYRFGDKATSVKWEIPAGCKVLLYDDDGHRKVLMTLEGAGQIADIGAASDRISSVQWLPK